MNCHVPIATHQHFAVTVLDEPDTKVVRTVKPVVVGSPVVESTPATNWVPPDVLYWVPTMTTGAPENATANVTAAVAVTTDVIVTDTVPA